MSRLVGIIPARAGSVGIHGKNAKPLAGYPLVTWTLVPALRICDVVVLTTNDPEVRAQALVYAGERLKIHDRTAMLATARTPDLPVILDAYCSIEQRSDDVIVLLRPTAPFRMAEEIRSVAELLKTTVADSVRSVVPARESPQKAYLETRTNLSRVDEVGGDTWPILEPATGTLHRANHPRQGLRRAWKAAGFIDAVRADVLIGLGSLEGDVILGWVAPRERALDLDTPEDWARAEALAVARGWTPGEVGR